MTRAQGLAEMQRDPYADNDLSTDTDFVVKKFGITHELLEQLVKAPNHQHIDYPNANAFIEGSAAFRNFIRERAKRV